MHGKLEGGFPLVLLPNSPVSFRGNYSPDTENSRAIVIRTILIHSNSIFIYFQTHAGSVWKVTWAHPLYGQLIATCSFDRTAALWEETGWASKILLENLLIVRFETVLSFF